jgi:DNA-binding MarR family transcriptional regulator
VTHTEPLGDNGLMNADAELDRKVLAAVERLGRALRAARQHVATCHELSLLGVSVIETLADGRARRVGDLAAELDVSQPTVSDAVTTLDKRRLIARDRDPKDLRSSLVTLTNDGHSVATDIATELRPVLAAEAGTSDERATTLRVLLGEIARLQAAGIITVNRSCLACRHYQPPATRTPARCLLLDTALHDQDLRVDCPEHEPATA